MGTVVDRYRSLPRAARWGVLAAGALLAFEAWNQASGVAASFESRAEAASAKIERYEGRLDRLRGGGGGTRAVVRHGEVLGPGEAGERREAMGRLIDGLVEDLGIGEGWRYTEQSGPLRVDEVSSIFGGRRVERLTVTFSFEGDAETATAVVRELEASPIVVSVPRVTMRVVDRGEERVGVRVDAETWVFRDGGGA